MSSQYQKRRACHYSHIKGEVCEHIIQNKSSFILKFSLAHALSLSLQTAPIINAEWPDEAIFLAIVSD